MNKTVDFNINSEIRKKFILKSQANQLSERGIVHYLDLSTDEKRFEGLLPQCYYYGDEEAFLSFLTNDVSHDLQKRYTLFQNGESLDNYPLVTVIAVNLQSEDNKLSLLNTFNPYIHYIRALKYSLIVNWIDREEIPGFIDLDIRKIFKENKVFSSDKKRFVP